MQILEVLLYIISIILIGITFSKRPIKKQHIAVLFSIAIITLTLHLIFGGSRWQVFSLYFAVFVLGTVVYFKVIVNINLKTFVRIPVVFILTLLIVVSLVSSFIFPVYEIPEPSGDYLIGTESFVIDDELILEAYTNDSSDYRKIKIQVWYPAEDTATYEQAPWLDDGIVVPRGLSKSIGLPYFILDHTKDIMSHSYIEAPLSKALEIYPVIIISHGWGGFRNIHTDFAEELASLGYIVIGVDHTYGSVATLFSDEEVAYLNPDALPLREDTPDFLDYATQLVDTYASDITATINFLEKMNASTSMSKFSGKLDLNNIGLIGHSTGGGAAVDIALDDDRIASVIGLDAWVEPIDDVKLDNGLTMPSLFIRSGDWETGFNNKKLYELIDNSSNIPELYQINGITHYDFAMVYMYSPLTKNLGYTGELESEYLTSILKSMITDFFNETIKNDTNSNIDSNKWDEVIVVNTP